MSRATLHLSKQNFKFSAAHFLIFNATAAERLHGHNYQVRVDIDFDPKLIDPNTGYSVDFKILKHFILQTIEKWDEMVLLPKLQKDMRFEVEGVTLKVNFRDRFYAFPQNEVLLLPLANTSTEEFSRLLAEIFFNEFKKYQIKGLRVYVEETPGQGASSEIRAE